MKQLIYRDLYYKINNLVDGYTDWHLQKEINYNLKDDTNLIIDIFNRLNDKQKTGFDTTNPEYFMELIK